MLRFFTMKSETKRQVRFPGICGMARKLGVSREHLYRVLIGQRTSWSLKKRYEELKGKGDQLPERPTGPQALSVPTAAMPPARVQPPGAAPQLQKSITAQKGKGQT